jgi:hypothetical protein
MLIQILTSVSIFLLGRAAGKRVAFRQAMAIVEKHTNKKQPYDYQN